MKIHYFCIHLHPNSDEDFILDSVIDRGAHECFVAETEEGIKELYGYFPFSKEELTEIFKDDIQSIIELSYPEIDWKLQWESFSPHSENGVSRIELLSFNGVDSSFNMIPGPGFGDLSHPTTQMMLTLFPQNFMQKEILDVGSGSGILSIAAAKLNAFPIYGVDICKDALQHCKSNAELNSVDCTFLFPDEYLSLNRHPHWIFLNMITSEQNIAFKLIDRLRLGNVNLITSGVLKEERESYLHYCRTKGWSLVRIIEREGWLGFHFSNSPDWNVKI